MERHHDGAYRGSCGYEPQTLYKEFTSRQGLASGYLIRFVDEFLEEVEREVALHHSDPGVRSRRPSVHSSTPVPGIRWWSVLSVLVRNMTC